MDRKRRWREIEETADETKQWTANKLEALEQRLETAAETERQVDKQRRAAIDQR